MKQDFRLSIKSPYGEKRPIEQFEHFIRKVADEADTRWGITIEIERVEQSDEEATKDEFQ